MQPWVTGLWLGRDTLSDECMIGTAAGVVRRAVRRLQEPAKMDAGGVECHALHTVIRTSESSRPPSSAETNVQGTN